ncbi:MAG TPA: hypothetical protein VMW91_02645 [Desulfosporosinus sp.]|nr:hypothetical protein [Desulfosporosinus sp.]
MGLGDFWAKISGQQSDNEDNELQRGRDAGRAQQIARDKWIDTRANEANLLAGPNATREKATGYRFKGERGKRMRKIYERIQTRADMIAGKKRSPGRAQTILTDRPQKSTLLG